MKKTNIKDFHYLQYPGICSKLCNMINILYHRKLHVLQAPDTDALNLVLSMPSEILVAGCENSCFGWKAGNLKNMSRYDKN